MASENERQDTRKAMAFDLCRIIDEDHAHDNYTKEQIKSIIDRYIEADNEQSARE